MDKAKVEATTERDIRRHMVEDGFDADEPFKVLREVVSVADIRACLVVDGFRTSFFRAVKKAKVYDRMFHDLRGTAVTRLAIAGCTAQGDRDHYWSLNAGGERHPRPPLSQQGRQARGGSDR